VAIIFDLLSAFKSQRRQLASETRFSGVARRQPNRKCPLAASFEKMSYQALAHPI
jgi:hypothetical protein